MSQAEMKPIGLTTREHLFGRTHEPDGPKAFAVMPGVPTKSALQEASDILACCEEQLLGMSEQDQQAYGVWQLTRLVKALVDASIPGGYERSTHEDECNAAA